LSPIDLGFASNFLIALTEDMGMKGCDFALGDVNQDGLISLTDVDPFVNLLIAGDFQCEADINEDGAVTLTDVDGFVAILIGG
jgi:hypothetical protein